MLSVRAASAQAGTAPGVLDLKKVKIEIVGATFVKELTGVNNAVFKESNPSKYRGLVLTLKVQKPAGEELTLYCQDLVLHYRYGDKSDVARCYGISAFSVGNDVDRPMFLSPQGLASSSTGAATTKASVVYVDLFFQNMEPDTSELHLFVAQPIGASYKTDGWR